MIKTTVFKMIRELKKKDYANYLKMEDKNSVDLPPLENKPLVSVIFYAEGDFGETLEAIKNQTNYANFEVIAVSDRDIACEASAVIVEYGCDKNTAYKLGLEVAQGEYVCFIDSNALLSDVALYYMIRQLIYDDYDIIYCDEDIVKNGERKQPFFKPGWSPDTLRSFNYIGFALIKRELIKEFESYYKLLIELSFKSVKVCNVERVLVHCKERKFEENIQEKYKGSSLVSIIIPSRDNFNVLKRCVESIREKSSYTNYEIIVVDNGSSDEVRNNVIEIADKYIYKKMDFNFSKMCNMGVERADGEYLLFLNDDTEVITEEWLEVMLRYAENEQTGAVGCKLIYPENNKIQHCGVVNIQSGPVHCFTGEEDKELYFGRGRYSYNYSAVTGACLMIEKRKFKGFDESFPAAYNDVDLCLSLIENGYYNVVVNSVKLYHYESMSRGNDKKSEEKLIKLYNDRERLNNKHGMLGYKDKFYNRNLTQHRADFSIENTEYINRGKFARVVLYPERYFSDKIKYKIEYIAAGDMTTVGGYAYIEGQSSKIYVLVMTRSDVAVPIQASAELRPDIGAKFGSNTCLSGFRANIDTCLFEKGEYQLGLMLVNRLTGKKNIVIVGERLEIML